jgi:uncharacterized protein (TIGR03435 family)
MRSRIALFISVTAVAASSRMGAQNSQKPSFEVASIKLSPPGRPTRDAGGLQTKYLAGGRFTATNISLKDLIVSAYRVQYWQISGGAKWVNPDMMVTTDRFNIEAKAANEASEAQMRLMLQSLLVDRFKLTIHRETKTGTVYNLVIAKGGHKLEEVSSDNYSDDLRAGGGGRVITDQLTMRDLAVELAGQVQTPVIDMTGLKGAYKFRLVWTPDQFRLQGKGRDADNGEPGIDASGPTLFTALQEQLGLKLEKANGPVEYLVLDSAEKPSEN